MECGLSTCELAHLAIVGLKISWVNFYAPLDKLWIAVSSYHVIARIHICL